jgi:hypothetical protein
MSRPWAQGWAMGVGKQGRWVGWPRSGSRRPVRVGEREREAGEAWVNQIKFELFQTYSNLTWSKQDLSEDENFEIKYGLKDLEEMNNFFHINFFRFKMDFELKSR